MTAQQPTSASCHSCGAAQDLTTRFCAECGAAAAGPGAASSGPLTQHSTPTLMLAVRESPDLQPPFGATSEPLHTASVLPPNSPHKPRRGLAVKILAAASVLAAVAGLAWNDQSTHQRLTKNTIAYSASQSQLKTTRTTLANTVTQLTGVKSNLTSTESALTTTKAALLAKEQDLTGVQNNLNDAKSNLTIKAGQVETLKNCLTGVMIALRDYANADYSGTIAALDSVHVSCTTANKLL
jgi:hypothetical protein